MASWPWMTTALAQFPSPGPPASWLSSEPPGPVHGPRAADGLASHAAFCRRVLGQVPGERGSLPAIRGAGCSSISLPNTWGAPGAPGVPDTNAQPAPALSVHSHVVGRPFPTLKGLHVLPQPPGQGGGLFSLSWAVPLPLMSPLNMSASAHPSGQGPGQVMECGPPTCPGPAALRRTVTSQRGARSSTGPPLPSPPDTQLSQSPRLGSLGLPSVGASLNWLSPAWTPGLSQPPLALTRTGCLTRALTSYRISHRGERSPGWDPARPASGPSMLPKLGPCHLSLPWPQQPHRQECAHARARHRHALLGTWTGSLRRRAVLDQKTARSGRPLPQPW
ncbi:collagen alpha-1(X) chain-like [Tupaia chinensis]|uniref:collagen alpha-1(X) chain-like n=1 Tax=Tupaia chinensis TaxID=246437 RepID=UPI0003C90113|nr:collagen alpha-1(X) chain-like [Tupaia chinensis]XP_006150424.1 collagen alpha-1(X) chain-like [Tupaia chinensis]